MTLQSTVVIAFKDGTRQSVPADSVIFKLPNGGEIEAMVQHEDHIAPGLSLSSPPWDPVKLERTSHEPTVIVVRALASNVISVNVESLMKGDGV